MFNVLLIFRYVLITNIAILIHNKKNADNVDVIAIKIVIIQPLPFVKLRNPCLSNTKSTLSLASLRPTLYVSLYHLTSSSIAAGFPWYFFRIASSSRSNFSFAPTKFSLFSLLVGIQLFLGTGLLFLLHFRLSLQPHL